MTDEPGAGRRRFDGHEAIHVNDDFEGGVTQKAVLFRPDGDVLLVQDTAGAYDWEFPGGRVGNDETAQEGLRRELREETGLDATVERPVVAMRGGWIDGDGEPLFTVIYRCETAGGSVTLSDEHVDFEWVTAEKARARMDYEELERAVTRAMADRRRAKR